MNDTAPSDAELTMREEGWMLSSELLAPGRKLPPEVVAMRLLRESAWDSFVKDLEASAALRFFNPEQPDFSVAESWEQLAQLEGMPVFDSIWRIPPGLDEDVKDFCREVRRWAHLVKDPEPHQSAVFSAPWVPWGDPTDPSADAVLILRYAHRGLRRCFRGTDDCESSRRQMQRWLDQYRLHHTSGRYTNIAIIQRL